MSWQIAIDGPAASGKSTVAKLIATKLNFEYLDTGAMYRAIALKALNLGIDVTNENNFTFLEDTKIDFIDSCIYLDGVDVSKEIRTVEISNLSSDISKFLYVREKLVDMQRKLAGSKNIIMDGRDIGTVVLPNANLKIYMTASVETRAKRRMEERKLKGLEEVSFEETIEEIKKRDYNDSNRKNSPLKKADDAIELDTSDYSVNEVVEKITLLVLKRGYSMEDLKNVNVEENEQETKEEEAAVVEAVEEIEKEEETKTSKYKEMQLVRGKVVEVEEAQPAKKINGKEIKAKEERVLITLEDGQEGYLFKKDTAGIQEDEELFDMFIPEDELEVVIKKIFPDGGKFIFSTVLVEKRKELANAEELVKEHKVITAKVLKQVSDFGLLLKYEGYTCLLPTQLLQTSKDDIASLVGKEIEVVPIRVDYSRIRIIVSEIHALSKKQKALKKEFLEKVEVGQVYDGVVKNIETYGAFVELGNGVEGLLHISEIDHNRISKVEKVLNVGDPVKVQVIKVEKDHIGLSRKALMVNHWAEYFQDKEIGSVVTGKVIEINKAGIRVDLATEIEGFVPRSEYSYNRELNIEDNVKVGDEVTGKLIEFAQSKKRIIISVKQMSENPWAKATITAGEIIDVVISNVGEDGFKVTSQDVTGYMAKQAIKNPDNVNVGDTVKVKVRVFDADKQKFIVSAKDVEAKAERENISKFIKSQDKLSNTFGDYISDLKK